MEAGGGTAQRVHAPVMKTRVDCGTRPQNFKAGWEGLDYERRERSPKQNIQNADSLLKNIPGDDSLKNLFLKTGSE